MRLFVGGSDGLKLFEDEDLTRLHDDSILALTRCASGRFIAGTEEGKILSINAGGETQIAFKDIGEEVHGFASVNGTLLAGSYPAALWISKDHGSTWKQVSGFDGAPNKDSWTSPWGTALVSALGMSSKSPRTYFAGVEVGGFYRTRDAGRTWFDMEIPTSDVHAIAGSPAKPERVFVTTGEGAFTSDDEGLSWRKMGTQPSRSYTMGVAAHPVEADRVVISAAAGPPPTWKRGGAKCDVLLSTDAGKRFRIVAKALKGGVQRQALTLNQRVPSEVAFGTSTGDLHYSNDGGEHFDKVGSKLGDIKAVVFA